MQTREQAPFMSPDHNFQVRPHPQAIFHSRESGKSVQLYSDLTCHLPLPLAYECMLREEVTSWKPQTPNHAALEPWEV